MAPHQLLVKARDALAAARKAVTAAEERHAFLTRRIEQDTAELKSLNLTLAPRRDPLEIESLAGEE